MKRISSSAIVLSVLLAGCNSATPTRETYLENPLFAQMYGDMAVDFVTNLEINKHAVTEDEAKKAVINATREEWLPKIQASMTKQRQGGEGGFVQVEAYTEGTALYVDDTLYFGPNFFTSPSANVHVYITTSVDPRLTTFPDESAIDLGELISPFGTQQYDVPSVKNSFEYRTAVLWDQDLELVLGFAQLSYAAAK